MLAVATICGSSVASNFWRYIFPNNSSEWTALGALFVLELWISVYLHLCYHFWVENKLRLARTSQYLLQNFMHMHGSTHMHKILWPGRPWTVFPLSICKCNYGCATFPFSPDNRNVRGLIFLWLFAAVAAVPGLSVFERWCWIPSEIRPQISSTEVHLSLHWYSCG